MVAEALPVGRGLDVMRDLRRLGRSGVAMIDIAAVSEADIEADVTRGAVGGVEDDLAMRINGIRYMTDVEANVTDIFYGRTTYRKLRSKDGDKMTDAYLKQKLTEEHACVGPLL